MALGAPRLTSPRRAPGAAFLLSDRPAVTQDGQCAAQREYSPTRIGVKSQHARQDHEDRRADAVGPVGAGRDACRGRSSRHRPVHGRLGAPAPHAPTVVEPTRFPEPDWEQERLERLEQEAAERRAPRCEGGSRARVRRAAAAADTARTEAKVMAQVVVGAISDRLGLASSWETVEAVTPAVASTQGSRGWSTEERRPRRAWRDAARTG
jgi:hypothetical protein